MFTYVNRSISLTIKIILSVQDNFCQTFATVIASEQVEDQVKEMNENNLAIEEVPTVQKATYRDWSLRET
jgi:hypothetical protein